MLQEQTMEIYALGSIFKYKKKKLGFNLFFCNTEEPVL